MKTILLLVFLVLAAYSHNVDENTVSVITDKNFAEKFSFDKPTFFLLYAPWCGHCKALIPTWNKLQEAVPEVTIASVNCDDSKSFCGNFADKGRLAYPMLRFVGSDRQVYIYEGKRDKNSLVGFVNAGFASARTVPFPPRLLSQLEKKADL